MSEHNSVRVIPREASPLSKKIFTGLIINLTFASVSSLVVSQITPDAYKEIVVTAWMVYFCVSVIAYFFGLLFILLAQYDLKEE